MLTLRATKYSTELARSAGGFGGFHLWSVKPPFWIRWRLRELERECENGRRGWGRGTKNKPTIN